jgi:hypothetical protein
MDYTIEFGAPAELFDAEEAFTADWISKDH